MIFVDDFTRMIRVAFLKEKSEAFEKFRFFKKKVENKHWIIDSVFSHHMTGDMRKFVKIRSHDGGIVTVGNNAAYHITQIGSITLDYQEKGRKTTWY